MHIKFDEKDPDNEMSELVYSIREEHIIDDAWKPSQNPESDNNPAGLKADTTLDAHQDEEASEVSHDGSQEEK